MPVSLLTITALAKPFDGGAGPSHGAIEGIWATAGASEYLGDGSKQERVLTGLRALRDGRAAAPGVAALGPDHRKLQLVASDLALRLITRSEVDPASVAEVLGEPAERPADADPDAEPDRDRRKVMVVHGRDDDANKAMYDWLRAIGLRPREFGQLVADTGSASPFIGNILEIAFAEAQAVVVLFTPDERVQLRVEVGGSPNWRLQARPNVLFEAGMALSSHPKRTVLVVLGEQEMPSDLAGRHYVRLGSVSALRDLAQRLEHAGCIVDISGDQWLDVDPFPNRSGVRAAPER